MKVTGLNRPARDWPRRMLTFSGRFAQFEVMSLTCRALLTACFAVAVAAILAALPAPASAHSAMPHDTAQPAPETGPAAALPGAETCCHHNGSCTVQILPGAPDMQLRDAAPTALPHLFAAVHAESMPIATDPPPPRP